MALCSQVVRGGCAHIRDNAAAVSAVLVSVHRRLSTCARGCLVLSVAPYKQDNCLLPTILQNNKPPCLSRRYLLIITMLHSPFGGIISHHVRARNFGTTFSANQGHTWSAVSGRRAVVETIKQEIVAWKEDYNQKRNVVNWQFSTDDARIKLKHLYPVF